VIEGTGSLPLATITTPYFPVRWLAAAVILNGGALAGIKLRQFVWQRKVWAVLSAAALTVVALLLIAPDGRVHVYALDVGTGSAVLVRTANGHQLLIDGGPDADKFTQAIGRALPPTARTIDIWLITGGRRTDIGAAASVLSRFEIKRLVIADPDPWSATLRALVQQARASGIPVVTANGPLLLDGVLLASTSDQRTWLLRAGRGLLAIVPPDTAWHTLPPGLDGAVFTSGGPAVWEPSSVAWNVIEVASPSREGLPGRAFLHSLQGARVLRTDHQGTVEILGVDFFEPAT